jgi:hypothetical protein
VSSPIDARLVRGCVVTTWWYVCWCRGGGLGEEDAQASARWPAARPVVPFTPAQYQELEQQALIYKYLVAGVPVPPDLVVPIRRGLDSLATRFYGQPTRTYGISLPLLSAPCQTPSPSCTASGVLGCLLPPRDPDSLFIPAKRTLPPLVNLLQSFVNPWCAIQEPCACFIQDPRFAPGKFLFF